MQRSLPIIFVNSHPVQYFAPLYQQIAKEGMSLHVIYCTDETIRGYQDHEFGVEVKWDIPLLQDYEYIFLDNQSWKAGLKQGFFGIINPQLIKQLFYRSKSVLIVHGWHYASNLIAILFGKISGHIVCVRGDNPHKHETQRSLQLKFLKRIFIKWFLSSFVDYFLYVGVQNKKYYEFYGVKKNQLLQAHHAVDNDRFTQAFTLYRNQKTQIKKELGLPSDKKIILYSGKYISKKNPLDLLRAYHLLERNDTALVMVGEGELRVKMQAYIEQHRLEDVYLTGFVNQTQIEKYYAIADVFVMCSGIGETWGLSVNEAMNFNLPLLVSDMTGCSDDLVKEGVNGYTFQTGNVSDLKAKLENILDDDTLRQSMGKASGEIIKNYSYRQIIETLSYLSGHQKKAC